MTAQIRWKQRFQNFEKALARLDEACNKTSLDDLALNGMVQRFEFTLELGWKTLKDYLEQEGFMVRSPRETIRQAFQSGYIIQAQVWMDAIDDRNKLSHDYDETHFRDAEVRIRNQYSQAFHEVYQFLKTKL